MRGNMDEKQIEERRKLLKSQALIIKLKALLDDYVSENELRLSVEST